MQIPQHLQHYAAPTLIVVGDHETAKVYLAHDENIEEMETLTAPERKQPDVEGSVNVRGERFSNPSTDEDDGVRRAQFTATLADYLEEALRGGDADALQIVMPADMCRRLQDALPGNLQGSVGKTLEIDLAKMPLTQTLERLNQ